MLHKLPKHRCSIIYSIIPLFIYIFVFSLYFPHFFFFTFLIPLLLSFFFCQLRSSTEILHSTNGPIAFLHFTNGHSAFLWHCLSAAFFSHSFQCQVMPDTQWLRDMWSLALWADLTARDFVVTYWILRRKPLYSYQIMSF